MAKGNGKQNKRPSANLAVEFGAPGKNKSGTRRLGVKVPVDAISHNDVAGLLIGARLDVVIEEAADPKDVDGQEVMDHGKPDLDPLETSADVKAVRSTPTEHTFSLVFPAEVGAEVVDAYSYKHARMVAVRTGNAATDEEADG